MSGKTESGRGRIRSTSRQITLLQLMPGYFSQTAAIAAPFGSVVMGKNLCRFMPAVLLACALPLAVQASDANDATSRQVSTAAAHAGMALGAGDLKMAHTHLHHVVNCLVGPSGKAFDAKAADPCKGQGQGAIVDARGDAATEARLHTALDEAKQGLKTTTLDGAHADAQKVLNTLQAK